MPEQPKSSPQDLKGASSSHAAKRHGKTIEQIYQKKTQLEHILLRPDTYVGSCEPQMSEMWVFDRDTASMQFRKITYTPALYKIFDEILVNAADHLQRSQSKMDKINVTINQETGEIAVYNNGDGVPVEMHKEHNVYVPELIFGNLLTSDNYDDNEKKVTGGRNGYGAKLTNVFSKKFVLETADHKAKKRFTQVMRDNMSVKEKPKIEAWGKEPYTRVTFQPDLEKFGMRELDDDTVSLFHKRVWDIAATTDKKCKVFLNDKALPINDFHSYVNYFVKSVSVVEEGEGNKPLQIIYEKCNERWEVCVTLSLEQQFQQVSFVNSINTIKGGTHVSHVTDQLVEVLLAKAQKGNKKGMQIKPANVKQHLWVFVNCLVENPAFDSQTKETLKTQQSKFGSKCELSDTFIKDVLKNTGVIDMIVNWAKAKEKVDLGRKLKSSGNQLRVLGVPKLEDANEAGGKKSSQCTLILTEGDSAKALAVAGLSVIGRDFYGVFPLRGKVLNVREAAHKTLLANAEIQSILKIMGLTPGQEYDDLNKLRYGSIMIMTDQDLDGSHIKGLLINLIEAWWPSLMKHKGFLKEFVTPIVKVHKNGKNEKKFYTLPDYEAWKLSHNNGKGWDIKYYKGLGTSTAKEAKEYFRDIEINEIKFSYTDDAQEAVDLAFNKARADDRKDWMNNAKSTDIVDHNKKELRYTDFVNKELVWFSKYAALRAIPNVIDGFKPGQRKIVFCAFKKKLKKDIKVAQFVGYVSEKGAYHHGEKSLEDTIVGMAQDFVGSNNLNLFFPSGQFGTRLAGGSDHASARYIFTRLMPYTRNIFNEVDDNVLEYQNEEGQWIEPTFYVPVIPMVLVNGAQGIGVGWSTNIPNFNPLEIIDNLRRYLRRQPMTAMAPWYKGFIGDVAAEQNDSAKYLASGIIRKISETQLEILELPIKEWTSSYKEFLESLLPGAAEKAEKDGKKKETNQEPVISDCREYHTENSVHFVLKLTEEQMVRAENAGLAQTFKLKTSIATTNMMLFDTENKIKRYETANDILEEFAITRLEYYDKRKKYLIDKLGREKMILDAKVKFILMIIANKIEIRNKRKKALMEELLANGFKPMSEMQKGNLGTLPGEDKEGGNDDEDGSKEEEEETSGALKADDFNYLLGMPLWNLTQEKVDEMKRQAREKTDELRVVEGTTRETMWDNDLTALRQQIMEEWDKQEKEEEDAKKVRANTRKKQQQNVLDVGNKKGRKAAAKDDDDDKSGFKPQADVSALVKSKKKQLAPPAGVEAMGIVKVDLDERREYMKTRQVADRVEKKTGKRGGLTQPSQAQTSRPQSQDDDGGLLQSNTQQNAKRPKGRGKKKKDDMEVDSTEGKQAKLDTYFSLDRAAGLTPGDGKAASKKNSKSASGKQPSPEASTGQQLASAASLVQQQDASSTTTNSLLERLQRARAGAGERSAAIGVFGVGGATGSGGSLASMMQSRIASSYVGPSANYLNSLDSNRAPTSSPPGGAVSYNYTAGASSSSSRLNPGILDGGGGGFGASSSSSSFLNINTSSNLAGGPSGSSSSANEGSESDKLDLDKANYAAAEGDGAKKKKAAPMKRKKGAALMEDDEQELSKSTKMSKKTGSKE